MSFKPPQSCLPERSEAPTERSRKPALSAVEGDPATDCEQIVLESFSTTSTAFPGSKSPLRVGGMFETSDRLADSVIRQLSSVAN